MQRIQTEDKLRSMEMGHIHQMNNLNFERKSFQDFFKKQKRNVDKLYKSDKTKILHLADIATTTIRVKYIQFNLTDELIIDLTIVEIEREIKRM